MALLIDAIRQRLIDRGVATSAAIVIGLTSVPPAGDAPSITLIAAGGGPAQRTHNGGRLLEGLAQVSVRARSGQQALQTAQAAHDALDVADLTLAGVRVLWMRPVQPPLELPADATSRALVAFRVQARYAA